MMSQLLSKYFLDPTCLKILSLARSWGGGGKLGQFGREV